MKFEIVFILALSRTFLGSFFTSNDEHCQQSVLPTNSYSNADRRLSVCPWWHFCPWQQHQHQTCVRTRRHHNNCASSSRWYIDVMIQSVWPRPKLWWRNKATISNPPFIKCGNKSQSVITVDYGKFTARRMYRKLCGGVEYYVEFSRVVRLKAVVKSIWLHYSLSDGSVQWLPLTSLASCHLSSVAASVQWLPVAWVQWLLSPQWLPVTSVASCHLSGFLSLQFSGCHSDQWLPVTSLASCSLSSLAACHLSGFL